MRDTKKTTCLSLTFVFALFAIIMISVALATQHWVYSVPVRLSNVTTSSNSPPNGTVNLGLFRGEKQLSSVVKKADKVNVWVVCSSSESLCGWSRRPTDSERQQQFDAKLKNISDSISSCSSNCSVYGDLKERSYFSFNLWVSTLVFAGLGIIWGLISMVFTCINMATTPIETITGPMGLYVWNAFACLSTFISVILFVVLYVTDLEKNILEPEEIELDWTSEDRTNLSWSFWLMVVASITYVSNIIFVIALGTGCESIFKKKSSMNNSNMDGVMMY